MLKWNITDIELKNLGFKDPMYIEMVSGKVYEINKADWKTAVANAKFKNLPLWDSPILIAERHQITLVK